MEPAVRDALEANLATLSAPVAEVDGYARLLKQTLCMGPNTAVADWDFASAVRGTPLAALLAELTAAGRVRQAASIRTSCCRTCGYRSRGGSCGCTCAATLARAR